MTTLTTYSITSVAISASSRLEIVFYTDTDCCLTYTYHPNYSYILILYLTYSTCAATILHCHLSQYNPVAIHPLPPWDSLLMLFLHKHFIFALYIQLYIFSHSNCDSPTTLLLLAITKAPCNIPPFPAQAPSGTTCQLSY